MNNFTGIYHNLRKIQPESARTLVRKILETKNGNVRYLYDYEHLCL